MVLQTAVEIVSIFKQTEHTAENAELLVTLEWSVLREIVLSHVNRISKTVPVIVSIS